ncbi:MAG: hypothetical protein HEP71_24030 [Roseivirga sp.]|nr:hypothetical protein [Roseivirga sp.]
MLSTTLILISGVLGIFWSVKARNSFTKLSGLLLSVSSLAGLVNYLGIQNYAPYAIALFSLMAAYEPFDSARIKKHHKIYFGMSGVLFAVVVIDMHVTLPFNLILWPLVTLFFISTLWVVKDGLKMIRTRLAYISIWVAQGLVCIINAL